MPEAGPGSFRTNELMGNESTIPRQGRIGFGDAGHLPQCFPPQTLSDLGGRRALGIAKAQSRWRTSFAKSDSRRPGIHFATVAPGSPNP